MKKRKQIRYAWPVAAFVAMMMFFVAGQVQADETAYIDFGRIDPNVNPEGYNHVGLFALTNSMDGGTLIALTNTSGEATGWTLDLANSVASTPVLYDEKAAASKPAVAKSCPSSISNDHEWTAWRDNIGIEDGDFIVLSFENLNKGKKYNLTFFGARGDKSNSQTWSMNKGDGGNSDDTTTYDSTNTSYVISYTNIVPFGSYDGIRIKLNVPSGSGRGAINLCSITEIDAPDAQDPSELFGGRLEIEGYEVWDGTNFVKYYFEMAPEYNGGNMTDALDLLTGMGVNLLTTRMYTERQLAEWAAPITSGSNFTNLSAEEQTALKNAQKEGFQRYLIAVHEYNKTHDPDIGVYLYQREHLQEYGEDLDWASADNLASLINDAQNGVSNSGVAYDDAIYGAGPVEPSVDRIDDLCRVGLEWIADLNEATDYWAKDRMFLWPGLGRGACYYAYNVSNVLEGIDETTGSSTFYEDMDEQVGSFAWVYKQMLNSDWDSGSSKLPSLSTTPYATNWNAYCSAGGTNSYGEKLTFLQDEVGLANLSNLVQTCTNTLLNNVFYWGDAGDTLNMGDAVLMAVHDVLMKKNDFDLGFNTGEIMRPEFRPLYYDWIVVDSGEHVFATNDCLTKAESFKDADYFNINFSKGGNAYPDAYPDPGLYPGGTNTFVSVITNTGIAVNSTQTVDLIIDAGTNTINIHKRVGLGTFTNGLNDVGHELAFTFNADLVLNSIVLAVNNYETTNEVCSYQIGTGTVYEAVAYDCVTTNLPRTISSGEALTIGLVSGNGIRVTGLSVDLTGGGNVSPFFNLDPIYRTNAVEDSSYSGSIAGEGWDADLDSLTYSETAGPAWLTVSSAGVLSGTPGSGDVGTNSWTVQVSDGNGGTGQATLNITVDEN